MEIRALREHDDRTLFRSGDADLDRFFAKYAGQNQFRHHLGTTYVALEADRIVGYLTVAAGQLEAERLPPSMRRKLPAYPLPVLRLARLAVDVSARDRGVGKGLLRHAFHLALRMSQDLGCIGVVVDAKPLAVSFYAQLGFSNMDAVEGAAPSRPGPAPMFLPLELVAKALAPR